MKKKASRILVSHVGSLPRPHDLLDMMKVRLTGGRVDEAKYQARVTSAVAEIVKQQVEAGIDIVADGETSKAGFFTYAKQRLGGLAPKEGVKFDLYKTEHDAFPEYYDEYFKKAMMGGTVVPPKPLFAVGPITYTGQSELRRDLDNLRKAVDAVKCEGAFVPSTAPSGVGRNEYYKSDEEFFFAVAEAMRTEYAAIIDAGFDLQVDDPFLSDIFGDPKLDLAWVVNGWPTKADLSDNGISYVDMTGMPTRAEVLDRYVEVSGRQVDDIDYYCVLAKWKLAVVLEQGYQRATDETPALQAFGPIVLDLMRDAAELAESSTYAS